MKKTMLKESVVEIKNTIRRFISILLIVLLGVGFFAGIKATSPDMKKTIDKYFSDNSIFDIQIFSSLGLDDEDIDALSKVENVELAQGGYAEEASVKFGDNETVVNILNVTDKINKSELVLGRMPAKFDECVVENNFLKECSLKLGDTISVTEESISGFIKFKTMEIVGTVNSPLYISRTRGYTKLGNGKINYFVYVTDDNISCDAYTAAYIKVKGTETLNTYDDEYKNLVDSVIDNIKVIAKTRETLRYEEVFSEANDKITKAKKELSSQEKKLDEELTLAKKKIKENEQTLDRTQRELVNSKAKAKNEFETQYKKINEGYASLEKEEEKYNSSLALAKQSIKKAKEDLAPLKTLQTQYNSLLNNISKTQARMNEINIEVPTLNPITDYDKIVNLGREYANLSTELSNLNYQKSAMESSASNNGINLSNINSIVTKAENQITSSEKALSDGKQKLENARATLDSNLKKLKAAEINTNKQIENGFAQVKEGREKIVDAKAELAKKETEANKKIDEAKEKIAESEQKLQDIKKPSWYVLNRESNVGYSEFMADSDRISNIGKVFPIVFFVVAALISLTSMTRMVEEQRTSIGTMKALGYSNLDIANKYIIYALLATVLGGSIGMIIGFRLLPDIIFSMYQMMYTMPKIILEFNIEYALIGLLTAVFCTVFATVVSLVKELKSTPSALMIPKAPKPGKRVFLERIPFIWNKLNFNRKVTVRNMFRYKKRLLMTVIGIMGCTSLIVAGFGLRDSISYMIPSQYEEIYKYDASITFKDSATNENIDKKIQEINKKENIEDSMKTSVTAGMITANGKKLDMQIIVPKDIKSFNKYILLKNRKTDEQYELKDNSVILTEKQAKLLNVKVGDSVSITNDNDKTVEVKVTNITENYLLHFVYMNESTYNNLFNENIKYNTLYINTKPMTESEEEAISTEILSDNTTISAMSFTSSVKKIFGSVMDNMSFVVWILIISAGLLDFVVLYNLANVNIGERIRELATVKVLGFYDKEVYNYISRETVILTIIGILFGFVAGVFLNTFIISTCELDMLMFDKTMHIQSFIYGAIITMVFTGIVNVFTYFTLKKINMIEALKSVD